MTAGVDFYARDIDSPWWGDPSTWTVHRLSIHPAALDHIDELPWPDYDHTPGEVVHCDGEHAEVLDLATGERWCIRRAQCGLGHPDAWQAWRHDRPGPLPEPEVAFGYWWYFDDEWDLIDQVAGWAVSEAAYPDMLRGLEQVRGRMSR